MSDDAKIFVSIPCGQIHHELCMQCFIHLEKQECPMCRFTFTHLIPDIKNDTKLNLIQLLTQNIPISSLPRMMPQMSGEYTLVLQTNRENDLSEGEVVQNRENDLSEGEVVQNQENEFSEGEVESENNT